MPGGISYPDRPKRAGAGIEIRSLSPDQVDEFVATGAAVTAFQFVPVPTATTTGPGFVTFMSIPVQVDAAGRLLVTFAASVEVEVLPASASFQGGTFRFLWDRAVIPPKPPSVVSQTAFLELDVAGVAGVDTFSGAVVLPDLIDATAGLHTLEVQFEGVAAESKVDVFDGNGSLTIQGVG